VIDRLFALNAKRAEEEKIRGFGSGGGKQKGAGKKAKRSGTSGQKGLPGMDDG
jgi:hypothetical protein